MTHASELRRSHHPSQTVWAAGLICEALHRKYTDTWRPKPKLQSKIQYWQSTWPWLKRTLCEWCLKYTLDKFRNAGTKTVITENFSLALFNWQVFYLLYLGRLITIAHGSATSRTRLFKAILWERRTQIPSVKQFVFLWTFLRFSPNAEYLLRCGWHFWLKWTCRIAAFCDRQAEGGSAKLPDW